MDNIEGIYEHFKGSVYVVTGRARHSETGEDLVIYRSLDPDHYHRIWVRPYTMFFELMPNGRVRFERKYIKR